jgi:hypothetical protein
MTTTEKVKNYILKNPSESNRDVAEKCDTTKHFSEKMRSELRKEGKLPAFDPKSKRVPGKERDIKVITDTKEEIRARQESARVKALESNLRKVLSDYEILQGQYDNALLLQENTNVKPAIITFNTSIKSQATPIIQWSDFHVEERIEKKTTQGLNEYNPTIAEKRVNKLAENTIKLIRKERQDTKINELVVCLGGDFINNFLHEHDVQMNFMHPIEAAVFAKTLLVRALSTVAKYGNFKKIIVMCIRGNHGRLTKRMQSSNDYMMNIEAVLYYMLKQELVDSTFEFHIPESEHGYLEVYGKTIRCFHGHQVNYQGGVGDITIPVNKAIMKWDKTVRAHWNLMHHYHRFWTPSTTVSLNGSLCGWNSYALSCGFAYEPPLQAFQLLDAKRGFTVRTPIHCE